MALALAKVISTLVLTLVPVHLFQLIFDRVFAVKILFELHQLRSESAA